VGLLQRDANAFLQGDVTINAGVGQLNLEGLPAKITGAGTTSQSQSTNTTGEFTISNKGIEQVIEQRLTAKKSKNFAEADRIRKELADAGIILEDTPQGTTWRRA
jgi:cysteinyl-tRNA synthetase